MGAGGGLGGGNGGGGRPGGVWGLRGLGGVRGLAFLSFFFDSLTFGPVTDELPLDVRCFLFRFFFSFSFSFRLPLLSFPPDELGDELLLSLFFFFSFLDGLSDGGCSTSASWLGSLVDGPAFDLLANRKGLAGLSVLCLGSFLVGFGAATWEFSTNATLPLAFAGVRIGGAFGGGNTRVATVVSPLLDDDGRLASLGLGFGPRADELCSVWVSTPFLGSPLGLDNGAVLSFFLGLSPEATPGALGALPPLPFNRSSSRASCKVSSNQVKALSRNLSA